MNEFLSNSWATENCTGQKWTLVCKRKVIISNILSKGCIHCNGRFLHTGLYTGMTYYLFLLSLPFMSCPFPFCTDLVTENASEFWWSEHSASINNCSSDRKILNHKMALFKKNQRYNILFTYCQSKSPTYGMSN